MQDNDKFITLGYIGGVFGIKGWVKVFSYTRPKSGILDYPLWYINKRPVKVLAGHPQGQGIVAQLEGLTDRNQAALLTKQTIQIKDEQLADLDNETFYWSELLDLDVFNIDGVLFGQVKELMETGANDVMLVEDKNGKHKRLIPWVWDIVIQSVDLEQQKIIVDWATDF